MRFYKIPKWSRILYPNAIWDFFYKKESVIYLTFDDGPNPVSTDIILEILENHHAKATFFCLGNNVADHTSLFEKIRSFGHQIGNHGMHHLNGFKTSTNNYIENASEAAQVIPSKLYRPAYGKIKKSQYSALKKQGYQIVFWSLLSYDFDSTLMSEKRLSILRQKTKAGSILVFHDNEKSIDNLKIELPILLKEWSQKGFVFKTL